MQKIGTIAFVQIQREPLKIDNPNPKNYDDRIYRTSPIEHVAQLQLTKHGILGLCEDGEEVIDVHNERHPQSRYRGGNKISFGFVKNYNRMRERFGEHITTGDGGENILVDAEIDIANFDTSRRLFLQHGDTKIELVEVMGAPPCRPFSVYCASEDISGADLKHALQFLSDGTRGYYAELADTRNLPYTLQAGDTLWMA
ncbi:MAG: hypothetical protein AAFV98_07645 [Chloroflexota bacterium]